MKSLHHYLAEAERQYEYKVKVAIPAISDDQLESIERILAKFDLVSMSAPKKTVFQSRPMDFDETVKGEINIITVKTRLPMSGETTRQLISRKLGLSVNYIQIRGENDPLDELVDMDVLDVKVGESNGDDALLNKEDPASKLDINTVYGSDYNNKLVKDAIVARDKK